MLEPTETRAGRLISDADSTAAWDDDDGGGTGRRRKSSLLTSLFQQDSSGRRVSFVARLSRLNSRRDRVGVLDVQRAAMHIHDAVDGVCRPKPQQGETARQAQLAHLAMRLPLWCTLVVYVLLTFFECPGWAVDREHFVYSHPKEYPVFGLPVLSRWWAAGIELACLFVLIFELTLRIVAQGPRRFFRYWRTSCPMNAARRVQSVYFLVLLAALIDALATLATPQMSIMAAPYLRLACIVLHSDVLLLHLYAAARTLPSLFSVAFVLAAFLLFFGWLGLLIFRDTAEGKQYMPSLSEAMWSLLILMTTANYPDVMMPAYADQRAAVFYFAYAPCPSDVERPHRRNPSLPPVVRTRSKQEDAAY